LTAHRRPWLPYASAPGVKAHLGFLGEGAADPPPAVFGRHCQTVDPGTPSVPAGEQASDNPAVVHGHEKQVRVLARESR
jgi:hypothetical protein